MTEFEADLNQLRQMAGRLRGTAEQVSGLANGSASSAAQSSSPYFPIHPTGQKCARTWDSARDTFTDGLRLLESGLRRMADGVDQSAKGYADTDASAAGRFPHPPS